MPRGPLPALLALTFAAGIFGGSAAERPTATAVPSEKLHNLYKIDAELYSGSSPDDEAGFAELKTLGVTTIISVDGSKPNVALAQKYGLKYIHLPVGYDGVSPERTAELIKAASDAKGGVYVHCHHGKHRGPAAVAMVCQGVKGWKPDAAVEWLKQAGTATDYAGLYRDVREFTPPSPEKLAKIGPNFPEVAPTPPLVDVMVEIDTRFDDLKTAQKAAWNSTPSDAANKALHMSTLLWEQYREMARLEDTAKRPADYREKLDASLAATEKLVNALREPNRDPQKVDLAFKEVGQQCAVCHRAYRNKR